MMKFWIFALSAAVIVVCLVAVSCAERSNPFDPKSPNYVGDICSTCPADTVWVDVIVRDTLWDTAYVSKSDTTPTLKLVNIIEGAGLGPGGNANLAIAVKCELYGCLRYGTQYFRSDNVSHRLSEPSDIIGVSEHYFSRFPMAQSYEIEFFCKCEVPQPSVSSDTLRVSYSRQ